jgi:hypothetical protein
MVGASVVTPAQAASAAQAASTGLHATGGPAASPTTPARASAAPTGAIHTPTTYQRRRSKQTGSKASSPRRKLRPGHRVSCLLIIKGHQHRGKCLHNSRRLRDRPKLCNDPFSSNRSNPSNNNLSTNCNRSSSMPSINHYICHRSSRPSRSRSRSRSRSLSNSLNLNLNLSKPRTKHLSSSNSHSCNNHLSSSSSSGRNSSNNITHRNHKLHRQWCDRIQHQARRSTRRRLPLPRFRLGRLTLL